MRSMNRDPDPVPTPGAPDVVTGAAGAAAVADPVIAGAGAAAVADPVIAGAATAAAPVVAGADTSDTGDICAAAAADPEAGVDADVIFEQHREALKGLAYRMLGDTASAEDVVQDAWIRWHG